MPVAGSYQASGSSFRTSSLSNEKCVIHPVTENSNWAKDVRTLTVSVA